VDRALRHGSLSGAAGASINPAQEDTVRSHLREATQAAAPATARLPRMGIDPQRASGETRTTIVGVPTARLLRTQSVQTVRGTLWKDSLFP
jgi:hypothetical protein